MTSVSHSPATRARRIGVDLTPTLPGGVNGGAKPAAFGLVSLLAEDPDRTIVAYVRASYFEPLPFENNANVEIVRVADSFLDSVRPSLGPENGVSLSIAMGVDVLLAPYGDPNLKETGVPVVAVRYDVQHLDFPEFFTDSELNHRAEADQRLARESDRVITSSEFSKQRMTELLDIPDDRIDVIPLAAPPLEPLITSYDADSRLRELSIEERGFFYYPANFWPHKNHQRLIEAFARYHSNAGVGAFDLVLTGDVLDRGEEIRAQAEELGVADFVHILGFVDKATQDAIWTTAGVLVFPSLYEGFGIPLLEALIRGKEIVASNAASIPEVAGDLGFYFDPEDVVAMSEALATAANPAAPSSARDARRAAQLRLFDRAAVRNRFLDILDLTSLEVRRGLTPLPSEAAFARRENRPLGVVYRIDTNRMKDLGTALGHASNWARLGLEVHVIVDRGFQRLGHVEPELAAGTFTTTVFDNEAGYAAALNAAIEAMTADYVIHLDAPNEIYPGNEGHLLRAAATMENADVIHGASVDQDTNGRMLREHPTAWCRPGETDRRHAIPDTALVFRRNLVSTIGGFKNNSVALMRAELLTQLSPDALFVFVPLYFGIDRASTETLDLREPDPALANLAHITNKLPAAQKACWLIDRCESVLISRSAPALDLPTFRRRVANDLIWFAPYLLGRSGITTSTEFCEQLTAQWRSARANGITTSLLFAAPEELAFSPRSPLIAAPLPDTLARFAHRILVTPDPADACSPRSLEAAIGRADAGEFTGEIRHALAEEDDRRFAVSAFEATHGRTPRPHEIEDTEFHAYAIRLDFVRELATNALREHLQTFVMKRRKHDYFAAADNSPTFVSPMGEKLPVSVSDWNHLLDEAVRTDGPVPQVTPERRIQSPTSTPRVSIICSLYRGQSYIDRYLRNMVEQERFEECELIVIDAASPDGEHETIRQFAREFRNIRYHRCQDRIGIYEAWNLAVGMSSGEFLTNANLDDSRHSASIRLLCDTLDSHDDLDVAYSDCLYSLVPYLPWPVAEAINIRSNLPEITTRNLLEFNSPHCAPMWRRSLHDRFGLFDETFRSAGDWEFWLRCAQGGATFEKIEPPIVQYFQNPTGISTSMDSPAIAEEEEIRTMYRDLLIAPERPLGPRTVRGSSTEVSK